LRRGGRCENPGIDDGGVVYVSIRFEARWALRAKRELWTRLTGAFQSALRRGGRCEEDQVYGRGGGRVSIRFEARWALRDNQVTPARNSPRFNPL